MKYNPIFRLREIEVYSDDWEFFYNEEHVANIKRQKNDDGVWMHYITFTDAKLSARPTINLEGAIGTIIYYLELIEIEANMNV